MKVLSVETDTDLLAGTVITSSTEYGYDQYHLPLSKMGEVPFSPARVWSTPKRSSIASFCSSTRKIPLNMK